MSFVKTVIKCALYCSKCDKYFKYSYGNPCPDCGGETSIEIVEVGSEQDPSMSEVNYDSVTIGYKEHIRYSATLGVTDEQFADARKIHPQANWKKFGNHWRPEIRTRTDKKLLMKQSGMEEYPPNLFRQIDEKSKWENRRRRK